MSNKNSNDDQKVVLVTGASSGLGKSIATHLSENGYRVFGTSRKPKGRKENFEMLQLDITSDASVKACVSELMKKAGKIDILINNAGVIITGALEEVPLAETKLQFETNFFGPMRMVSAILPIMRKQKGGQIINVASIAAILPVPFQGTYAATKSALIAYSEALRHEVKSLNINVSVIEPGYFNTEALNKGDIKSGEIKDYTKKQDMIVARLKKELKHGGDPIMVADIALKIVQTPSPKFIYPVGKEKIYLLLKRIVPQSLFESQYRQHWKLDE
jgi:short-subunit dehydrogenase